MHTATPAIPPPPNSTHPQTPPPTQRDQSQEPPHLAVTQTLPGPGCPHASCFRPISRAGRVVVPPARRTEDPLDSTLDASWPNQNGTGSVDGRFPEGRHEVKASLGQSHQCPTRLRRHRAEVLQSCWDDPRRFSSTHTATTLWLPARASGTLRLWILSRSSSGPRTTGSRTTLGPSSIRIAPR